MNAFCGYIQSVFLLGYLSIAVACPEEQHAPRPLMRTLAE